MIDDISCKNKFAQVRKLVRNPGKVAYLRSHMMCDFFERVITQ